MCFFLEPQTKQQENNFLLFDLGLRVIRHLAVIWLWSDAEPGAASGVDPGRPVDKMFLSVPWAPGSLSLHGPHYICFSDWKLPFPFPPAITAPQHECKHTEDTCTCFICICTCTNKCIWYYLHNTSADVKNANVFKNLGILLHLDKSMIPILQYTKTNTLPMLLCLCWVCEPTGGYNLVILLIFTHNVSLFPFLFKKLTSQKPNAFTRSPLQAASLPRNVCTFQKRSKLQLPNTAVQACRHHRPKQFMHRHRNLFKLPHSTCPVR